MRRGTARFAFILVLLGHCAGSSEYGLMCTTVGAAEPKLPAHWSLPLKGAGQETDSWCWACSTQMVMGYFGTHVFQGEMANLGIGLKDCSKSPVPAHCLYGFWGVPILDHFRFTYEYTHGPLSPDEIKYQIYVRRKPIISGWKWTGDGAHYNVIKGYAQLPGTLMLEIVDPSPPARTDPSNPAGGCHYFCSYDKWVSDDGHKFMDAIYDIERPGNIAANLLRNGDFELGPDVEQFESLDKDSTAIPDWTVTRAQVDYVITLWKPAHGARSIDLHGSPGYGGIRQTFKTKKGQRYRLTFSMAGTPKSVAGEGGVKSLAVSAAGKQQQFRLIRPASLPPTWAGPKRNGSSTQSTRKPRWSFTRSKSSTQTPVRLSIMLASQRSR